MCVDSFLIGLRRILIKYSLELINNKLSLIWEGKQFKPFCVDFLSGKVAHRHQFGGGKGQLIAKAVGLKMYPNPMVLDLSAGFGQDAFVLASLGCQVMMVERCDVMHQLLADGVRRLSADQSDIGLTLVHADAQAYLQQLDTFPDVIYFDPMYPETGNTALNKREMQLLRELVGDDDDAINVFQLARQKAKRRIVIKRPRQGMVIGNAQPDFQAIGKSSRYDVYLPGE